MSDKTGIILMPPYGDIATGSLNLSFAEHDARLMFYSLYFDKIMVAPINIFNGPCSSTELEQILFHQRIIDVFLQKDLAQKGRFDEEFLYDMIDKVYSNANGQDIGDWAMAPPPELDSSSEGDGINAMVAILDRCLPCPTPDTNFSDIISFKSDNIDSLRRFRKSLNKMFFGISGSMRLEDISSIFEDDLKDSINDIYTSFKKSKIPFFRPNLSVSFSLPSDVVSWVSGVIGAQFGIPHSIVGFIGSSIGMGLVRNKFSRPGNMYPRDFQYLVTGMRKSLMMDKPDYPSFINNHERVGLMNNIFQNFYPRSLTIPADVKGGVFQSNIL